MKAYSILLFVWLVIGGMGCEKKPQDSAMIRTSYIWAEYEIEHRADNYVAARAYFHLEGPNGDPITLSGDDHVECNGRVMSQSSQGVRMATDGLYVFDLVRSNEKVTTNVQAPALPVITGIDRPDGILHSGDVLKAFWNIDQPGDYVHVSLSSNCIVYSETNPEYPEQGEFTFPPIKPRYSRDSSNCAATLSVTRFALGKVSSAFRGGSSEASRTSELALTYKASP